MTDVRDRVAFITGGTSGIGLGIARSLYAAGAKVAVTYRRDSQLQDAMQFFGGAGDRFFATRVDVTDRDGMERAAKEVESALGGVSILCNNAAAALVVSAASATFKDWDWAISVNIGGVINGLQVFLPRIRAHGKGGHIVSTASMSGLFVSGPAGVYATTKFAVVGMMEALRGELEKENIGVSVFCPGLVDTNIVDAEESRPERFAESGRRLDEGIRRMIREKYVRQGMNPLEAGRIVVAGILANDLYIVSHPEFKAGFEERVQAIAASFSRCGAVPIPEARLIAESPVLSNPIYVATRDKLLASAT